MTQFSVLAAVLLSPLLTANTKKNVNITTVAFTAESRLVEKFWLVWSKENSTFMTIKRDYL
jgi:hypothetical protein